MAPDLRVSQTETTSCSEEGATLSWNMQKLFIYGVNQFLQSVGGNVGGILPYFLFFLAYLLLDWNQKEREYLVHNSPLLSVLK